MTAAAKRPRLICRHCLRGYSRWPGSHCRGCGRSSTGMLTLDAARHLGIPLPFSLLGEGTKARRARWKTGLAGFDRILSHEGGIVPGATTLLAASPGSGKTTLLVAAAGEVARRHRVLVASAEQDVRALRTLAEKLSVLGRDRLIPVATKSLDELTAIVQQMRPALFIADSANELAKGSRLQTQQVVSALHEMAHSIDAAAFLTSHVNSAGLVRGGPELEHATDSVVMMTGDPRVSPMRELTASKNRHGDTTLATTIEMTAHGFVDYRGEPATKIPRIMSPGCALALVAVDGSPRVVQVEAALSPTPTGKPRGIHAIGCSQPRVSTLVGVVERGGIELAGDVVVRVADGVTVSDVAIDAAIVAALTSAATGQPVAPGRVHSGEVGLDGRLRPTAHAGEAERLGLWLVGSAGDRLIQRAR